MIKKIFRGSYKGNRINIFIFLFFLKFHKIGACNGVKTVSVVVEQGSADNGAFIDRIFRHRIAGGIPRDILVNQIRQKPGGRIRP